MENDSRTVSTSETEATFEEIGDRKTERLDTEYEGRQERDRDIHTN